MILPTPNMLKMAAAGMKTAADKSGSPMKLSACYEFIAKSLGFKDWNSCIAASKKEFGRYPTIPDPNIVLGQRWYAYRPPYSDQLPFYPSLKLKEIYEIDQLPKVAKGSIFLKLRRIATNEGFYIEQDAFFDSFYRLGSVLGSDEIYRFLTEDQVEVLEAYRTLDPVFESPYVQAVWRSLHHQKLVGIGNEMPDEYPGLTREGRDVLRRLRTEEWIIEDFGGSFGPAEDWPGPSIDVIGPVG